MSREKQSNTAFFDSDEEKEEDNREAATRDNLYYLERFRFKKKKLGETMRKVLQVDREIARTIARVYSFIAWEYKDMTQTIEPTSPSALSSIWWKVDEDPDKPHQCEFVSQEFASCLYEDWINFDYQCPLRDRTILAYEPMLDKEKAQMLSFLLLSLCECNFPHALQGMVQNYLVIPGENCLVDFLCECMKVCPHWVMEMCIIVRFYGDLARVYPNDEFRYDLNTKEQEVAQAWFATYIDELPRLITLDGANGFM